MTTYQVIRKDGGRSRVVGEFSTLRDAERERRRAQELYGVPFVVERVQSAQRPVQRPVEDIWADNTLEAVRKALYRTHPKIPPANIDRQTRSAYQDPTRWIESTPFKVIVVVEPYGIGAQIEDPYDSDPSEQRRLDATVNLLKKDPYLEDAGWESWNAAILYFWVRPRMMA